MTTVILQKVLAGVLMLVSIFSCQNPPDNISNVQCSICPPIRDTVVFSFDNTQLIKLLDVFRLEGTDVSYCMFKKENYDNIYSAIATEFNIQEASPYSMIIYTNTFFSEKKRVELTDIMGVSIYFIEDNYLTHKIYQKQLNDVCCIHELTCRVNRIYAYDIHLLTFSLFPSSEFPNRSWLALHPEDIHTNDYKNVSKNNIEKKLKKMCKLKSNVDPSEKCNAPCIEHSNGMCNYNPVVPPFWNCDAEEEPCLEEQVHQIIKTNDIAYDSSIFNTVLHYQFRDSIIQDSVGLQLVSEYYVISSYFSDKIDFDLALKSILVLRDINHIIDLYLMRDDSVVAMDSISASQFNNLLDDYIDMSTDSFITSRLNTYKMIIDSNIGKTGNRISFY